MSALHPPIAYFPTQEQMLLMMGRAERGGGSSGSSSRPGVGEETPAFSTRVAVKDYRPQIGRCLLLGLDVSLTVTPLGNP